MPQPASVLSSLQSCTHQAWTQHGRKKHLGADLATQGQILSLPIWDPRGVDLEGDVARGGTEGHALLVELQRFHLVLVVTNHLLTSFL